MDQQLPPGLAGWVAGQQSAQQNSLRQLQTLSTLQQLAAAQLRERQGAAEIQRNEKLREEIAKLPPEQRTRENVLPLLIKYGNVKELAPLLKGKEDGAFTLKPGETRYGPDGKPLAEAAPKHEAKVRQRFDGETVIQEEQQPDGTWKEIGRGPRFSKSVPAQVIQPPPVTTTEVVDPNDPTRMLKVDARTYKGGSLGSPGVVGVSGRLGDVQKANMKRQINSQGVADAIQSARDVLTGKGGQTLPTGSGVGAAVDWAASLVGASPAGAAEADKLRVIGGMLVQKVPRFEGPQSNYDVQYYKEVAGRVGDPALPRERRLAALEEVENIWGQFEAGKKSGYFTPQGPQHSAGAIVQPPGPAAPASPTAAPSGFKEGQTATNAQGVKIIFKNGQWRPM